MAKVSATLRPAASQSGMSFHLVLSVVYGLLTSVNMVTAELTFE